MEENNNSNQNQNFSNNQFEMKPALPNSTASLVLGIISLVTFFCYGIVSIVLGILAIVNSNKALAIASQKPGVFSESSVSNAKAGKVMGIIGVCIGGIYLLAIIAVIVFVGTAVSALPWHEATYH